MIQLDARSFLAQLLEATGDGVFALDVQGRILVWNRTLERMLGKSRDDAIGRHLYNVLPFFRETGEDWLVRDALAGRPRDSREQAFFVPDTGREGVFQGMYLPLRDAGGTVIGVLGILRDLTPLRAMIEETREEGRRRETALRRLLARRAGTGDGALPGSPSSAGAGEPTSRRGPAAGPAPRSSRLAAPRPAEPPPPPAESDPSAEHPPRLAGRSPLPEDPDSQIFDARAALGAMGSEGVLREMIDAFLASLPAAAAEMDRAVVQQDCRSVAQQVQEMKSAVAALGGHRATWVAARLELLAREGKGSELRSMWLRLRRELALLREAMVHRRRRAA